MGYVYQALRKFFTPDFSDKRISRSIALVKKCQILRVIRVQLKVVETPIA